MLLSGAATEWATTGFLDVGSSGTGVVDVEAGATLSSTDTATLGAGPLGVGTVYVSGSAARWEVGNFLNVGADGSGTVRVTTGGQVETTNSASLGTNALGVGDVSVRGVGAGFSAEALNVGFRGEGTLTVADGGLVSAREAVGLGGLAGLVGTVNLDAGGTLRASTIFGGEGAAQFNFNGGTLQAGAAGLVTSLDMTLVGTSTSTIDTTAQVVEHAGVISGTGALRKVGSGVLSLSGANTYSGATTVSAGTLRVDGDLSAATGAVAVEAGGTLAGVGTLGGDVFVAGSVRPGNGTGNLSVGSLTLAATALATFEIGDGVVFDQLTSAGPITLGGVLEFVFTEVLADGTTIDLFLGPQENGGNFDRVFLSGTAYAAGDFVRSGSMWTSVQGEQDLVFDASTGILQIGAGAKFGAPTAPGGGGDAGIGAVRRSLLR